MKTRFVTAITATAKTSAKAQAALPWARGARRAAFIAKREGLVPTHKSA